MSNHVLRSPRLEKHDGIWVVRDDVLAGGTKARIFSRLMRARPESEFVYAGPANGLAQVALAVAAYQACKQATIFVAKRGRQSARTAEAASYGARIIEVQPGYLSVVQARARTHAEDRGAYLVPFGGAGEYASAISDAARLIDVAPDEVWCAAGSGTLARALRAGWPDARMNVVEVGKECDLGDSFVKHPTAYPYERACRASVPFSADRFYEAKAWEVLRQKAVSGRDIVFWNVAGAV